MAPNITTFHPWHSVPKGARHFVSLLCAAASLWVGFHASTTTLRAVTVIFALAAVAVQLDQQVEIDPAARTVTRVISLGGRAVRSRRWPLDDFDAVASYRLPGTSKDPAESVYVGLRHRAGNILALRYFRVPRGAPSREAETFAVVLAAETGLTCLPG